MDVHCVCMFTPSVLGIPFCPWIIPLQPISTFPSFVHHSLYTSVLFLRLPCSILSASFVCCVCSVSPSTLTITSHTFWLGFLPLDRVPSLHWKHLTTCGDSHAHTKKIQHSPDFCLSHINASHFLHCFSSLIFPLLISSFLWVHFPVWPSGTHLFRPRQTPHY